MKLINLLDAFEFHSQRVVLKTSLNVDIHLMGETCLIIARAKADIQLLFQNIDSHETVLLLCLAGAPHSVDRFVNQIMIESWGHLFGQLKQLLDGRLFETQVMSTLVVDMISSFFWEAEAISPHNYMEAGLDKFLPRPRIYAELCTLLGRIRDAYKCNIIVTSFDSQFERGYNSTYGRTDRSSIDAFLLLPVQFIMSYEKIIHLDGGRLGNFDKQQGKMIYQ